MVRFIAIEMDNGAIFTGEHKTYADACLMNIADSLSGKMWVPSYGVLVAWTINFGRLTRLAKFLQALLQECSTNAVAGESFYRLVYIAAQTVQSSLRLLD
jgi:hypothetical protein